MKKKNRILKAKPDAYGTHFTTENIIETLRNTVEAGLNYKKKYVQTTTAAIIDAK